MSVSRSARFIFGLTVSRTTERRVLKRRWGEMVGVTERA